MIFVSAKRVILLRSDIHSCGMSDIFSFGKCEGRLRLAPLTLYAGAGTAPLRMSRFSFRRGGGFEVISDK